MKMDLGYGCICVVKKQGLGVSKPLDKNNLFCIGTSEEATIRIKDTKGIVQEKHCTISVEKDGVAVINNHSLIYPSKVNGAPVRKFKVLYPGDIISVGDHDFKYDNETIAAETIKSVQSIKSKIFSTPVPSKTRLSAVALSAAKRKSLNRSGWLVSPSIRTKPTKKEAKASKTVKEETVFSTPENNISLKIRTPGKTPKSEKKSFVERKSDARKSVSTLDISTPTLNIVTTHKNLSKSVICLDTPSSVGTPVRSPRSSRITSTPMFKTPKPGLLKAQLSSVKKSGKRLVSTPRSKIAKLVQASSAKKSDRLHKTIDEIDENNATKDSSFKSTSSRTSLRSAKSPLNSSGVIPFKTSTPAAKKSSLMYASNQLTPQESLLQKDNYSIITVGGGDTYVSENISRKSKRTMTELDSLSNISAIAESVINDNSPIAKALEKSRKSLGLSRSEQNISIQKQLQVPKNLSQLYDEENTSSKNKTPRKSSRMNNTSVISKENNSLHLQEKSIRKTGGRDSSISKSNKINSMMSFGENSFDFINEVMEPSKRITNSAKKISLSLSRNSSLRGNKSQDLTFELNNSTRSFNKSAASKTSLRLSKSYNDSVIGATQVTPKLNKSGKKSIGQKFANDISKNRSNKKNTSFSVSVSSIKSKSSPRKSSNNSANISKKNKSKLEYSSFINNSNTSEIDDIVIEATQQSARKSLGQKSSKKSKKLSVISISSSIDSSMNDSSLNIGINDSKKNKRSLNNSESRKNKTLNDSVNLFLQLADSLHKKGSTLKKSQTQISSSKKKTIKSSRKSKKLELSQVSSPEKLALRLDSFEDSLNVSGLSVTSSSSKSMPKAKSRLSQSNISGILPLLSPTKSYEDSPEIRKSSKRKSETFGSDDSLNKSAKKAKSFVVEVRPELRSSGKKLRSSQSKTKKIQVQKSKSFAILNSTRKQKGKVASQRSKSLANDNFKTLEFTPSNSVGNAGLSRTSTRKTMSPKKSASSVKNFESSLLNADRSLDELELSNKSQQERVSMNTNLKTPRKSIKTPTEKSTRKSLKISATKASPVRKSKTGKTPPKTPKSAYNSFSKTPKSIKTSVQTKIIEKTQKSANKSIANNSKLNDKTPRVEEVNAAPKSSNISVGSSPKSLEKYTKKPKVDTTPNTPLSSNKSNLKYVNESTDKISRVVKTPKSANKLLSNSPKTAEKSGAKASRATKTPKTEKKSIGDNSECSISKVEKTPKSVEMSAAKKSRVGITPKTPKSMEKSVSKTPKSGEKPLPTPKSEKSHKTPKSAEHISRVEQTTQSAISVGKSTPKTPRVDKSPKTPKSIDKSFGMSPKSGDKQLLTLKGENIHKPPKSVGKTAAKTQILNKSPRTPKSAEKSIQQSLKSVEKSHPTPKGERTDKIPRSAKKSIGKSPKSTTESFIVIPSQSLKFLKTSTPETISKERKSPKEEQEKSKGRKSEPARLKKVTYTPLSKVHRTPNVLFSKGARRPSLRKSVLLKESINRSRSMIISRQSLGDSRRSLNESQESYTSYQSDKQSMKTLSDSVKSKNSSVISNDSKVKASRRSTNVSQNINDFNASNVSSRSNKLSESMAIESFVSDLSPVPYTGNKSIVSKYLSSTSTPAPNKNSNTLSNSGIKSTNTKEVQDSSLYLANQSEQKSLNQSARKSLNQSARKSLNRSARKSLNLSKRSSNNSVQKAQVKSPAARGIKRGRSITQSVAPVNKRRKKNEVSFDQVDFEAKRMSGKQLIYSDISSSSIEDNSHYFSMCESTDSSSFIYHNRKTKSVDNLQTSLNSSKNITSKISPDKSRKSLNISTSMLNRSDQSLNETNRSINKSNKSLINPSLSNNVSIKSKASPRKSMAHNATQSFNESVSKLEQSTISTKSKASSKKSMNDISTASSPRSSLRKSSRYSNNLLLADKTSAKSEVRRSLRNDLTEGPSFKNLITTPKQVASPILSGLKKTLKTPRNKKQEPENDLTNISGVKKLLASPKPYKSPKNDLTNVGGIKRLLRTPKDTNNLTDVRGVKKLLKTPKQLQSPILYGVKKLMKTPRNKKQEPENDLTKIFGIRKLLTSPKQQKSPANDLTNVGGVKKLMKSPKAQKSPKNDLTKILGLKKLLRSPKTQKEPNNDLSDLTGVKKLLRTPRPKETEPLNDFTDVTGVKKLFAAKKLQKSPKNDLRNPKGLRNLLSSPKIKKSPKNELNDLVGVKELFEDDTMKSKNEIFNKVAGIQTIKVYSPKKGKPAETSPKFSTKRRQDSDNIEQEPPKKVSRRNKTAITPVEANVSETKEHNVKTESTRSLRARSKNQKAVISNKDSQNIDEKIEPELVRKGRNKKENSSLVHTSEAIEQKKSPAKSRRARNAKENSNCSDSIEKKIPETKTVRRGRKAKENSSLVHSTESTEKEKPEGNLVTKSTKISKKDERGEFIKPLTLKGKATKEESFVMPDLSMDLASESVVENTSTPIVEKAKKATKEVHKETSPIKSKPTRRGKQTRGTAIKTEDQTEEADKKHESSSSIEEQPSKGKRRRKLANTKKENIEDENNTPANNKDTAKTTRARKGTKTVLETEEKASANVAKGRATRSKKVLEEISEPNTKTTERKTERKKDTSINDEKLSSKRVRFDTEAKENTPKAASSKKVSGKKKILSLDEMNKLALDSVDMKSRKETQKVPVVRKSSRNKK